MKVVISVSAVLACALLVLAYAFIYQTRSPAAERLMLYCDDGIRGPVEEIVEAFQRRTGVRVGTHFAPTQSLLESLRQRRDGGLFLSADEYYVEKALEEGLIREVREIALIEPIILVGTGNPKGIRSPQDLVAPEVRLAAAGDDKRALDRITHSVLLANEISLASAEDNLVSTGVAAAHPAHAVALGHADAAIVPRPKALEHLVAAEIVKIDAGQNVFFPVVIGVVEGARRRDAGDRFADFISSDYARHVFAQYGYRMDGRE